MNSSHSSQISKERTMTVTMVFLVGLRPKMMNGSLRVGIS